MLIALALCSATNAQSKSYSQKEIKEDLEYLKSKLVELHPNLEIYNSQKDLEQFVDKTKLKDSYTDLEAYSLISRMNAIIQDGHTLMTPSKEFIEKNNSSGLYIPMRPYWDGEKLFVYKNYDLTNELVEGDEIRSINGLESNDLIFGMIDKMMRDGKNYNYPIWVLNNYFFEYYSYFFGCQEEYDIVLVRDGEQKRVKLAGLKRAKIFAAINQKDQHEKGISLDLDAEKKIAVLKISDWHSQILKKRYKQKFGPEIEKAMEEINQNGIQHLIIDLRDNQGGDLKNSRILLSYLLEQPFNLVQGYQKKKMGTLVESNGPEMGLHKNRKKSFVGNIFVLINGGSFSNSGIFCSALKKYDKATFIGEESGGSEFVISGNPRSLTLPNSGIKIDLPSLQYIIKDYDGENLHGIEADIPVKPSIEDLIAGEDAAMMRTLKLIDEYSKMMKR